MANDPINPNHYKQGKIEVIDFIEDQQMDFHIGNAIKYLCRFKHKGDIVNDLKKAIWYIQRRIHSEEKNDVERTKPEQIIEVPHTIQTCPWHGCFLCDEIKSVETGGTTSAP